MIQSFPQEAYDKFMKAYEMLFLKSVDQLHMPFDASLLVVINNAVLQTVGKSCPATWCKDRDTAVTQTVKTLAAA